MTLETIVEHTENQKDWPYVKPSSIRCMIPKAVTIGIMITSEKASLIRPKEEIHGERTM